MKITIDIDDSDIERTIAKSLSKPRTSPQKIIADSVRDQVSAKACAIAEKVLSDPKLEIRMRKQIQKMLVQAIETLAASYAGYRIKSNVEAEGRKFQITGIVRAGDVSEQTNLAHRTRNALDQLLRYGGEPWGSELVDVLEKLIDINHSLQQGHETGLRDDINEAKALLDKLLVMVRNITE